MPFRRKPYKKRPRKKARAIPFSKPMNIVSRRPRMAPRVLQFKRCFSQDTVLNATSPPGGWTSRQASGDEAICVNYVFSLSQIPDIANFTNLFDSYRIKGVRLQGYYSHNIASSSTQSQTMLFYCRDHLGQTAASDLSEEWFNQRPRSRKRVLLNTTGKPAVDIYMPLTQLANTYQSVTNNDYVMRRPKFISTNEVNTPHYGFNLRLARVDGNNWTAGTSNQYPTLKLFTTVYFEMRGINS